MVDANDRFGLLQAVEVAQLLEPFGITWFEEPVVGNDVGLLAG